MTDTAAPAPSDADRWAEVFETVIGETFHTGELAGLEYPAETLVEKVSRALAEAAAERVGPPVPAEATLDPAVKEALEAEHTRRQARLAETAPELVEALRRLGDNYGPLGVALTAAELTDPAVLIGQLIDRVNRVEVKTADAPAPYQSAPRKVRIAQQGHSFRRGGQSRATHADEVDLGVRLLWIELDGHRYDMVSGVTFSASPSEMSIPTVTLELLAAVEIVYCGLDGEPLPGPAVELDLAAVAGQRLDSQTVLRRGGIPEETLPDGVYDCPGPDHCATTHTPHWHERADGLNIVHPGERT